MSTQITVEVVYATPEVQVLLSVILPSNSTVADALRESGLPKQFQKVDFDQLQAGIWGNTVTHDHAVLDGDRVEFYRPLQLDPKEARRQLASLGLTMGKVVKG
ncbi:MAG: RnfH family protein [Gammaproteobacteria bacterium]|nr:RnfH family protein [Gammaproteobacteria bacterium]